MLNGNDLLKYLQCKTQEERKHIVFCGCSWNVESIDEWLKFHPDAFAEKWQRDIIEGMSDNDKQQVIRDACYAYFHGDDIEEEREINNNIELKLTEYVNAHKKTHYTVTMSFLCHATVEVDAENPDAATELALKMVDDGKVTTDDFKKDDSWPDSVEIDEVYNAETENIEKSVFSVGDHPKQKKDFEPKQEA